jgi:hypothetical protein
MDSRQYLPLNQRKTPETPAFRGCPGFIPSFLSESN